MSELQIYYHKGFEEIKKTRADGTEYWTARELAPVLEYKNWERFPKVIDRAMLACQNSGNDTCYHFREASKMIIIAKGAKRKIVDYELTRYAGF